MDKLPLEIREDIMSLAGSKASLNLALTGKENYATYKGLKEGLVKRFYPQQKKRIPFSSLDEFAKTELYSILNIHSLLEYFDTRVDSPFYLNLEGTYNLHNLEFNGKIRISLDIHRPVDGYLLVSLVRICSFANGYMSGLTHDSCVPSLDVPPPNISFLNHEDYYVDYGEHIGPLYGDKSFHHFHLGKMSGYQVYEDRGNIVITWCEEGTPRQEIRVRFDDDEAPIYKLFEDLSSYPVGYSTNQHLLKKVFEDSWNIYVKSKKGKKEDENKIIEAEMFYYSIRIYGHKLFMIDERSYAEKIYIDYSNNKGAFPVPPMLLDREVAFEYSIMYDDPMLGGSWSHTSYRGKKEEEVKVNLPNGESFILQPTQEGYIVNYLVDKYGLRRPVKSLYKKYSFLNDDELFIPVYSV